MKKTTEKRSTVSWTLDRVFSKWTMLALLAVAVLFPVVIQNSYYRGIGTKIVMYMLLASSVNVINGYSGQFSIGHAGFMCVGRLHERDPDDPGGVEFPARGTDSRCDHRTVRNAGVHSHQ